MKISVKIHVFSGGEFVVPGISPTTTVFELKSAIFLMKNIAVEQQRLALPHDVSSLADSARLDSLYDATAEHAPSFELKLAKRQVQLKILRPGGSGDLSLRTYPYCSVARLKQIIRRHIETPEKDQVLSYNGTPMSDERFLIDYNIKEEPGDAMNLSSAEESNVTATSRPFEIHLHLHVSSKVAFDKGKLSLGIDFSFNAIKNVKKSDWKPTAPAYREVTDGLSWICYCRNAECRIANEMFIVGRGTSSP
ncbi:MAG: ubiquitin-like protein [Candidatus Pacebacteria bacterium]|nr:ubiquitin-like protein [Candidatus Paceibacterota bacterium]